MRGSDLLFFWWACCEEALLHNYRLKGGLGEDGEVVGGVQRFIPANIITN